MSAENNDEYALKRESFFRISPGGRSAELSDWTRRTSKHESPNKRLDILIYLTDKGWQ
jgi:hypothetical protein